jgi:hypothetical protein
MTYRFSGHETFACRYAWLPKAVKAVSDNPIILTTSQEDEAMVELGVGKNMVRSVRFWAEAADIISLSRETDGHEITKFGKELLLGDKALDPYLEDIQTLWLIHWKLATNPKASIFAWDFLLNQFQEPELYASAVVRAFSKAVQSTQEKTVSAGSLEQLYDVFLHSYVPTRGRKGEVREDSLDCPLVELDLLRNTGYTKSALNPGKLEAKYAFRREEKMEISHALFAYCLNEYWKQQENKGPDQKESTVPFYHIVSGHGSPGQIFKIPEADIRTRLLGIEKQTEGYYRFSESAAIPGVIREVNKGSEPSLRDIYQMELSNA